MVRGVNGLIQVADFENIRNKMVLVMGTGSTGYGQTNLVSVPEVADSPIDELNMDNFREDLLRARQHQTGVTESLTNVDLNTTVSETVFAEYDTMADLVTTNNRVCADNQRSLEAGISSTFISSWNGILYHQVTVSFTTALQARYFFNAGGQIRFSASRTGTASNTKDTEWTNMLGNNTTPSGMGTIFFDYTQTGTVAGTAAVSRAGTGSSIGFYDLTTTNQQIYITTAAAGVYVENDYNIQARVNTGFGSGTEPTQIIFTFQFRDDDVGDRPSPSPPPPFGPLQDEQVTGTLGSVASMARPSGANVSFAAGNISFSQTAITTTVLS
jgi:hypothetical protein